MTNPFDILLPLEQQKKKKEDSTNPFDVLLSGSTPDTTSLVTSNGLLPPGQENQGFFNFTGNVLHNLFNGYDPNSFVSKLARGDLEAPQYRAAFGQAYDDFKNWFAHASFSASDIGRTIGAAGKSLVTPSGWGQIAKGILSIPVDFIEAASGQDISSNSYSTPLTPQAHADKIKNTVGAGVAIALTAGAAAGLNVAEKALLTPNVLKAGLGAASTAELATARVALGPLQRSFIKGSIEAGIAGTGYTLTARAGKEDVIVSTILNGIMFAPIGGAFSLLRTGKGIQQGKLPTIEENIQAARDLALTRGVKFTSDKSFGETINFVESLATSDDLAEAIIKGKIKTNPDAVQIFEGITDVDKINTLISEQSLGKRKAKTRSVTPNIALHKKPDGTFDVLYGGKYDISMTKKVFEQTGQAYGRIISHEGSDWRVKELTYRMEKPPIKREEITPVSELSKEELGFVLTDSELRNPKTVEYYKKELRQGKIYRNGELVPVDKNILDQERTSLEFEKSGKPNSIQEKINNIQKWMVENNYTPGDREKLNAFNKIRDNFLGSDSRATSPEDAISFLQKRIASAEKYYNFYDQQYKRAQQTERNQKAEIYNQKLEDTLKEKRVAYVNLESLSDNKHTKTVPVAEVRTKANTNFEVEAINPGNFYNKVFTDWAAEVLKLASNKPNVLENAHFDNPVSYRAVLAKVANRNGLQPEDLPILTQRIEERLASYLESKLPEEDKVWIQSARKSLVDYRESVHEALNKNIENKSEYLNEHAWSNGMFLDTEEAGRIVIRSTEDGRLLTKVSSLNEALDFVNKSGQAETFSFGDDLKALPPDIGAPLGIPKYREEWNPTKQYGPLGQAVQHFLAKSSMITTAGDNIKAMDNVLGTNMYDRIFYPTQEGLARFYAITHTMEKELIGLDKKLSKIGADREPLISQYIETDSPENWAINGVVKGKPLTPEKIAEGEWFAANVQDFGKVYEFRRMRENILKNGATADNIAEVDKLLNNLSRSEQEGVARLDAIVTEDPSETSIYEVMRYAKARQGRELNKGDFAATNRMTKDEIAIADEVSRMLEKYRKVFGVPDFQTLNNYFAHYRNFVKTKDNRRFLDMITGNSGLKTEQFISELIRTGEITSYNTSPIGVLRAYIRAGNRANILNPVVNEAKTALKEIIGKFAEQGENVTSLAQRVNGYIDTVAGYPDPSSAFTEVRLRSMNDKLWNMSKDTFNAAVKYLTGTVELATQGLRPGQGVRDFNTNWMNYFIRFGLTRTKEWTKYFFDGKLADNLLKEGHILGLDIQEFITSGGSQIKTNETFNKALKIGFTGSAQKPVFVHAQAAAFMETFKLAEGVLLDLARSKISKAKAYEKLLLNDTYDPTVIRSFDAKVSAGKFYEAARLLAQETARETIGQYGAAYHPYKWNTSTGRILGQYGQWTAMEMGMFARLASTGSLKYRYGALARWAAAQGVLYGMERTLGLNLSTWYLTPAVMFQRGGPAYQIGSSIAQTLSASDYERREGTREINRLIPTTNPESWAQLYLPFSFMTRDLARTIDDFSRGFYLQSIPQTIGIRTDQRQKSLVDEALGNYPTLNTGRY